MNDEDFMARAINLAEDMKGRTGPNPAVGCVLVKDGVVIAEAATGGGGRPHAEEQALAMAGSAARGATAYVSLEPCAQRSAGGHACSDLLIAAQVARVVTAVADPHPFASGAGLQRIRDAGIEVLTGVREAEARFLNAPFLSRFEG